MPGYTKEYGHSPVCIHKWPTKCYFNRNAEESLSQGYGFSSGCIHFKLDFIENDESQASQGFLFSSMCYKWWHFQCEHCKNAHPYVYCVVWVRIGKRGRGRKKKRITASSWKGKK